MGFCLFVFCKGGRNKNRQITEQCKHKGLFCLQSFFVSTFFKEGFVDSLLSFYLLSGQNCAFVEAYENRKVHCVKNVLKLVDEITLQWKTVWKMHVHVMTTHQFATRTVILFVIHIQIERKSNLYPHRGAQWTGTSPSLSFSLVTRLARSV